ncbi:MAG: hypothetical protein KF745_03000 [Phycisphaeraceae bacterium]|nr:hypothetical protein [Phycisphaeraceae bacterium]
MERVLLRKSMTQIAITGLSFVLLAYVSLRAFAHRNEKVSSSWRRRFYLEMAVAMALSFVTVAWWTNPLFGAW